MDHNGTGSRDLMPGLVLVFRRSLGSWNITERPLEEDRQASSTTSTTYQLPTSRTEAIEHWRGVADKAPSGLCQLLRCLVSWRLPPGAQWFCP